MINEILYSGYYPIQDKVPILKGWNKGNNYASYEAAINSGKGNGVGGVIASGIVYIDIDQHNGTEEEARNLKVFMDIIKGENLHCIIKKTSSGVHCYFRDSKKIIPNKRTGMLACGINAEIMAENCPDIVSMNGKIRETTKGNEITTIEALDELPVFFYPSNIKDTNLFVGEGERNNTLFSYSMSLYRKNSRQLSTEDCRNIATIINDYVFTAPIPLKEINTSLSDEQFKKFSQYHTNSNAKKKTDYSEKILQDHHVCLYEGNLYFYIDGCYQTGTEAERLILAEYASSMTRSKAADILFRLKLKAVKATPASPNLILFSNGILNIKTNELIPPSPSYFIRNRIPFPYNTDSKAETVDTFLDNLSCNDKKLRAVLEELAGECIFSSYAHSKVFFLYGSGCNGKTTFIKFLRYIVGDTNCSSSTIEQILDKFGQSALKDKLVNITDEIPDGIIKKTNLLKSLSGNSVISGDIKGVQEKVQFINYATLIFSGNVLPSMQLGKAEKRRFVMLPFRAVFDRTKNPEFSKELMTASNAEYMLKLAVEGLQRVIRNNGELTDCTISKTAMDEYEITNNTALGFYKNAGINEILNHSRDEVFEKYKEYCDDNDLICTSKSSLSKRLKQHLYLTLPNTSDNVRRFKPTDQFDGTWHD